MGSNPVNPVGSIGEEQRGLGRRAAVGGPAEHHHILPVGPAGGGDLDQRHDVGPASGMTGDDVLQIICHRGDIRGQQIKAAGRERNGVVVNSEPSACLTSALVFSE